MNAERRQTSFPRLAYPPQREQGLRTSAQWLSDKRHTDNAESLWRVHDQLYDLTNFAEKHPGGVDWIRSTKGTDVTEAFETHHLGTEAKLLLPRYHVRAAAAPRNSPFTFHPDGFYCQLKEAVYRELKRAEPRELRAAARRSDAVTDCACVCALVLSAGGAWLARRSWWAALPALMGAGVALSSLATCAHNYLHRRDNWRMHLINLAGFSCREWRVSHAMSHHLYTNTAFDIELSMLEPFLYYLPYPDKSLGARLGALYFPFIFSFVSLGSLVKGWVGVLLEEGAQVRVEEILLPLLLPATMWLAAGSAPHALLSWLFVLVVSSFLFTFFGLTAGHHDNTNFFEGDVPRSEFIDWGEHQVFTVVDRAEYRNRPALALMRFGEHLMHHLFPTLDHALLSRLTPLLTRACAEYGLQLRTTNVPRALLAQSRQLARRNQHDFSSKPPRLARL